MLAHLPQLHGNVVKDGRGKDDILGGQVVGPQHPQDWKPLLPNPEHVFAHYSPKTREPGVEEAHGSILARIPVSTVTYF